MGLGKVAARAATDLNETDDARQKATREGERGNARREHAGAPPNPKGEARAPAWAERARQLYKIAR